MSQAPLNPPEIIRESDWLDVLLPFNIGSGRSLYSGLEAAQRLRLRVFKRQRDGALIGRAWFGPGADGPPLHVHGGAVAYVLDEAMGAVSWMNDYPAMAANLRFEYVQMTPLLTDLTLEARITTVSDRRVSIESEIKLSTGEVCVRGFGEFARLSRKKAAFFETSEHDPKGLLKNPTLKWAEDRKP